MNKAQFLQKLQAEQAEWEQFLASIPAAQQEQAGLYGTWSLQDVIGHVTAWERYMTGRIRAHLRGDAATPHELWGEFVPPGELEDDELNNWMADQLRGRSFGEVLGMQREVRTQLISTLQATSEELLTTIGARIVGLPYHPDDPFWQVIASMSYTHIREHMSGLQAALSSGRTTMDKQLLDRIAAEHAQISALIQQVPAEVAAQPHLLGSWSAQDLLAHLIGWQATAIAVLLAVHHQTAAPDPSDEDEFNAASVAARHSKTWAELCQEFATTNATLLATAQTLTNAQWQDARVAGWLQGSTINHYRIHAPDFQRAIHQDFGERT